MATVPCSRTIVAFSLTATHRPGRSVFLGARLHVGRPVRHQNNMGDYGGESTSGVRMSLESLSEYARAYRDLAELLGDWHSHEAYEGDHARPSNADYAGWAAGVGEAGVYVGLILSKSTDDPWRVDAAWQWPRFSAWVGRKTATGTVIESARLTIETNA